MKSSLRTISDSSSHLVISERTKQFEKGQLPHLDHNPFQLVVKRNKSNVEPSYKLSSQSDNPSGQLCLLHLPPSIDQHTKIVPVFITGSPKSGKSHLMNRLIGSHDTGKAFPTGHTIDNCTQGVWGILDPTSIQTSDGVNVQILFLDAESMSSNCSRFTLPKPG